MSLLLVSWHGHTGLAEKLSNLLIYGSRVSVLFMPSNSESISMKRYVINHFYLHGNYIVGDYIDIHDNPSASFYQRQHTPLEAPNTSVEDIAFDDLSSNSPETIVPPVGKESDSGFHSTFPYLTQKCVQENRADIVEAEMRAACKGTAEALWRTLWNNENLGYVEVEHIDATTLFRAIEKWYGKLPYTERNFRGARNKR